jgi:hypothetical protein
VVALISKVFLFLGLTVIQIDIVDPEKFEVENSWFFFQKGLYARIQKRPEAAEKIPVLS